MSIGHYVVDWLAILAQAARLPMLTAILTAHYLAADDRNDHLRLGSDDSKRGYRARFPAPAYLDKGPPIITAGE